MRPQIAVTTALLASSAAAAPTPGLIGDLLGALGNVIGTVVQDTSAGLNTLLNQIGVAIHTNSGSKHGSITQYHDQCPFEIVVEAAGSIRFSPVINWPKGVNGGNYINWLTLAVGWPRRRPTTQSGSTLSIPALLTSGLFAATSVLNVALRSRLAMHLS